MNSQETLYILHQDDEIESTKLIGVLQSLNIPYSKIDLTEHPARLKESDYKKAPILYYKGERAELFWGGVIFIDQHFLNGSFQKSSPQDKAKLFELLETCDHEIFPVIYDERLPNPTSFRSSSFKLTNILRWWFLGKKARERNAITIKRKNLNQSNISLEKAKNKIADLKNEVTLPSPYSEIFNGAVSEVLKICD